MVACFLATVRSWITFGFQNGKKQATDIMRAAYSAGVNFFDTAEVCDFVAHFSSSDMQTNVYQNPNEPS